VIDETYRDFLNADYGAPHDLFADAAWQQNVVSLYSFSKAYCVPGHRVGAIIGGHAILDEIGKVIDCVQICAPRAAQHALAWAIPNTTEWRAANTSEIEYRARAFKTAMTKITGWRLDSIGAYFAYVAHPFSDIPVKHVAERLAEERGVRALPGPSFGPSQNTHLRLAFANVSADAIAELPARLAGFKP
jgi:aspartate/methionine/tyrosine aminotransferase